jgi:hypothetical protein
MDDLEAARRAAIRVLCDAQAREVLTLEDFEGRLDRLKHAPNEATLEAIIADLGEASLYPVPYAAAPTLDRATHVEPAPVEPAEYLRLSSVFASTKRGGSWTVPLQLEALVLLGEITLDLRDAVFGADVLDIDVNATLGSFTLIVPAGTQVENEIEETLSSSEYSTRSARGARPNGLLVRLRGRALLASVEVKEKFPSGLEQSSGGFFRRLLQRGPGG